MIPVFPKPIANKAIYLYLGSIIATSLLFFHYAMRPVFLLLGVMWVVGFFLLVSHCTMSWQQLTEKKLLWTLFLSALGLRWAWVIFSYFFYIHHTGIPFEFKAADSMAYWEEGVWLSTEPLSFIVSYLFATGTAVSDSGYYFYLAMVGKVLGQNIIAIRMFNAVLSAATVVLLYLLAKRNIGVEGGRIAAVMACFFPNLIYYCGLHLKESVMIFLIVAFLERSDYLLRSRHYNVFTIAIPVLLAISLFTFRTVLGIVALFSLATALVFTQSQIVGRSKRIMLISWGVLAFLTLWGGSIRSETENTWETRMENQATKRAAQTATGNRWAKYATGTVMAPIMFILPFPTMVDVDEQYNQQLVSGGNYVRTFLGGFVLIALISALFITKNWRNLSLIGSFVIFYLGILSFSGFANSERFLLPALPGLIIMASYGVTVLDAKNYRIIKIWYYAVPILTIGWAVFKLGSRSLL